MEVRYEVEIVELTPARTVAHDGYEVRAYPVEHRMKAFGYRLGEENRPGRFDQEAAERLGVPRAPALPRCSAARR